MGFLAELWDYAKARKKFILVPIILVSLLMGLLVVFASGTAVSPFLYTMF